MARYGVVGCPAPVLTATYKITRSDLWIVAAKTAQADDILKEIYSNKPKKYST